MSANTTDSQNHFARGLISKVLERPSMTTRNPAGAVFFGRSGALAAGSGEGGVGAEGGDGGEGGVGAEEGEGGEGGEGGVAAAGGEGGEGSGDGTPAHFPVRMASRSWPSHTSAGLEHDSRASVCHMYGL
jgi:hypothetical protein